MLRPGLAMLLVCPLLVCGCAKQAPATGQPAAKTEDPSPQREAATTTDVVKPSLVAPSTARQVPADQNPAPAPVEEPPADFRQLGSKSTPAIALPNRASPPPAVDEARVAAAGIRKLAGKHLTLFTDLPPGPAVDRLVDEFDRAYPQWCDYFDLHPGGDEPWQLIGCLIKDRERFAQVGLLPADLPPFQHGFFRGNRVWVYAQDDDYYQRHLLLHEGTHSFMNSFLGSGGPPWYSEGMAELMSTHAMKDGQPVLDYFPADPDDVPGWGRIRLVHDAIAAGRNLKFDEVLRYNARAHIEVEPYGWSWAAAAFLENHPRYRERFKQLRYRVAAPDFNGQVRELYAADWPELAEEWQVFADGLEYGYDLEREGIDFRPGQALPSRGATVEVAADRGWQSSGITLEAGQSYRLQAQGQYQVADEPRPWISEPAGVTVRYYRGHPLGALLAAVHPEPFDPGDDSVFLKPQLVGADATLQPTTTGTLYLRINDSPGERADNAGTATVTVTEE